MNKPIHDVLIVGGGPAGLSAALMLGRCLRKVLLIDAGEPRNKASRAMHGYLSRDGISPQDFLDLSRKELNRYPSVLFLKGTVKTLERVEDLFKAVLSDKTIHYGKKLLLAVGIQDVLPKIEGFETFYGRSIFHCPYCDGFETRNKKILVYGTKHHAFKLARVLHHWSKQLVLVTESLTLYEKFTLKKLKIPFYEDEILRLEGEGSHVQQALLKSGSTVDCEAMFFSMGQNPRLHLAEQLNCDFNQKKFLKADEKERSNRKGIYIAGDASRDAHLVINAAAEGAKAAIAIHKELS